MKTKRQGEIKNCTKCDAEYEHFATNRYSLCKPCRVKQYQKTSRLTEEEYKKPYPLDKNEKKKRYCRIQRELDKAETAEERRAIYAKELDFIFESGIWLWCIDRRKTKHIPLEPGKIGRKKKETQDMRLKWPDTRGKYE